MNIEDLAVEEKKENIQKEIDQSQWCQKMKDYGWDFEQYIDTMFQDEELLLEEEFIEKVA